MKKLLTLLTLALFAISCASTQGPAQTAPAAPGVLDYGDYSSSTLTTKAWDALNAGQYMAAVKYTEKCAELYEETAREMQASLNGKAPKGKEHDYWALNDVGTSYFIRGEALVQLGRKEEALVAYRAVQDSFGFAQTWDPKGWFWTPADAAGEKALALSADF